MRALHRITGFLLFLLVAVVGIGVGQAALRGGETWSVWIEIADTHRFLVAIGAIGAALIALGWLLSALPRGRGGRFLSFPNPGGDVHVSLEAIRDYLIRAHADFPGVVKLTPDVRNHGGELVVSIGCEIRAGSSIPDLAQQIQDRVRERIVHGIGLTSIREIRVVIRQIVEGGRLQGVPRKPKEEPEDATPENDLSPATSADQEESPRNGITP